MDRLAIVHTTQGNDLLFRSMNGTEGLSNLFQYQVEMVSTNGLIDLNSLLGQSLSLQVKQLNNDDQWFNGDIVSMKLKGIDSDSARHYLYQATVMPKLWYLSQDKNFRIFQEKTVPEIILQILSDYHIAVDNRLYGKYRQWGYCVQYNESSLNFISRLMEHEGIYYYFIHEQGQHTLVLADAPEAHQAIAVPVIPYREPSASVILNEICVNDWQVNHEVTASLLTVDDYNFLKPYATLRQVQNNHLSYAAEKVEVFEWPGSFTDHTQAERYAKIRQQERAAHQQQMSGGATSCLLAAGGIFTLSKAPRTQDNQEYLINYSQYKIWDNSYASGSETSRGQSVEFSVIPAEVVWRSPRVTPWPKTQGPQTARVVCPEGETIWTDKYGRVKVKFHWDRYASADGDSSCWIRVASSWAGMGYGSVQIPRLNDEVLVDFINGDPDRPIIVGRVYNEANTPPWELPANATQMGFLSRSKGGHKGTASHLLFEDKLGEEKLDIHSEKDMNISVNNNQTVQVNNNQMVQVAGDHVTQILKKQVHKVTQEANFYYQSNQTTIVDGVEVKIFNNGEQTTINQDRKLGIIGHDKVNIIGNRRTAIHGKRTHLVKGKHTGIYRNGHKKFIKGGKRENIKGGLYVKIESGGWKQIVNGPITISSPQEININSDIGINLNAPNQDNYSAYEISFVGASLGVTGVSESATGVSRRATRVSGSLTGLDVSFTVAQCAYTPFELISKEVQIELGNGIRTVINQISTAVTGLFIIS